MVSDSTILTAFAVLGTIAGALVGLLAEPIRNFFARRARREQLRRNLYSELLIKLQRALAYFDFHRLAIERRDTNYVKSVYKVNLSGPISFPEEVAAEEQYYELTTQERNALAVAYYNLRAFINGVNKLGTPPFDDAKEASELCRTLKEMLESVIYYVNEAFEDNANVLEKIDRGALLKDWRKFLQDPKLQKEYLSDSAKASLNRAAEKKKRQLLKH
jgi:hypothetical protein